MYKIEIFITDRNERILYSNLPRVGMGKTVNLYRNFFKYLMGDRTAYTPQRQASLRSQFLINVLSDN